MKSNNGILVYATLGTIIGAGMGIIAGKCMCNKKTSLKKTAGKALRAAGTFVEHMSF